MNQQRADVIDAIGNLEATIQEINATSEERFREAFDFVNTRFQEVFNEAFGGGSAHLSLQDPKNLLECGIEIMAQPPGKTAKALTLLSGGEKALTAISLLFAIFHFKPSPFCVLDEVDAPLDEANVGRFAAMLQRMKAETQFIVITHRSPPWWRRTRSTASPWRSAGSLAPGERPAPGGRGPGLSAGVTEWVVEGVFAPRFAHGKGTRPVNAKKA